MKMSIRSLDWFLILPLLAAIVMIAETDPPAAIAAGDVMELSVLAKGAALTFATLLVALVVAAASAIDRRCSEEYAFQIMANAALVAFGATMLVHLVWVIGQKLLDLPPLAGENMIGVITLAWVLSYYWFRLRGIAQ